MNRKTKSFSLIELLVVIAIIGILASFILPALSKARKTSQSSVCKSNQRQLGSLLFMYSSDNDMYFIASNDPNAWDDRLGSDYDGRQLTEDEVNGAAIGEFALYECPLNDNQSSNANRTNRSYSLNQGIKVLPNNKLGLTSGSGWSVPLENVGQSSDTIALFDYHHTENTKGAWARVAIRAEDLKDVIDDSNYWNHQGYKLNYLMVDSSVKTLSFAQTYNGLRNPWDTGDETGTKWDHTK